MGLVPVGVNHKFHKLPPFGSWLRQNVGWVHILLAPFLDVVEPFFAGFSSDYRSIYQANTTCFFSLELFLRHLCPKKFNFLSITIWRTFRWHFTLLLTSLFVIICCHLMCSIRLQVTTKASSLARSLKLSMRRPRLVLGWVTAREDWALWPCIRSSVWTFICDRLSI